MMTNYRLWEKIKAFDFDKPVSEYGFSTRLAKENNWTIKFTEGALEEYRKFMYLAATSDRMVSPSEIVDVVWHQHLIFTQSYNELCSHLGKKIEHIPSTHNRQDYDRFKAAKEYTTKVYTENFGKQPQSYWNSITMYDPLLLQQSGGKLRTFILTGSFMLLLLIFPAYLVLRHIYINLDNPNFLVGYVLISIAAVTAIELYNRSILNTVIKNWNKESFIFKLTPMELVYLREGTLNEVIHGYVNQLVRERRVTITGSYQMIIGEYRDAKNVYEHCILEYLKQSGYIYYTELLKQLLIKPVFSNISGALNSFKKQFTGSSLFKRLFRVNFILLSLVLIPGVARLITGIERDKPVVFITIFLVLFTAVIVYYLYRLTDLVTTLVADHYQDELVPVTRAERTWEWDYFLSGDAIMAASFIPLVTYTDQRWYKRFDSSGGSSCGSSCGGGGGGGGGCGGGCGGCGGCGG